MFVPEILRAQNSIIIMQIKERNAQSSIAENVTSRRLRKERDCSQSILAKSA